MITPEAVEAARKVMARGAYQMSNDELPYEHVARAALEAAAPHMLAEAWEAGRTAQYREVFMKKPSDPNPYRPTT